MKILYVAMKYDYGIPERGFSFEHYNLYDTLVAMGHDVEYFDFFTLFRAHGRDTMTRMLKQHVEEMKPDLMFTFLFSDEFNRDTLQSITENTKTVTFNWFADDHWRFDNFSRHWVSCFTYVSTTSLKAIAQYKQLGYTNVFLTQWAANPRLYKRGDGTLQHEVTFVGQAHGDRPSVIQALRGSDVAVKTWGTSWNVKRWHIYARKLRLLPPATFGKIVNSTRISQDEMIKVFQTSRINLNLSAASVNGTNQIKGRNFEIPACGGFQLSGYAERLDEYFKPGAEIVCYSHQGELIEKIRYYLDHEDERRSIAEAGFRRVLAEHTYEQRLNALFRQMHLA